MMFSAESFDAQ